MKNLIFSLFFLIVTCSYPETAPEILDKVDYNMTPDKVVYEGEMIITKKDKIYRKEMKIQAIGAEKAL